MNCAELELIICDYVDGTLPPTERTAVESHLATCPGCAELAADARAAVEFIGRAAEVEPPPQLLTRILFDPPWAKSKPAVGTGIRTWFGRAFHSILQPRLVMGMALTIISFSMLSRFVPIRQLQASDLQPAKVVAAMEDKGYRLWARTVKFYENLKFVYQIQSTLRDWQQQQEEERLTSEPEERKTDDRKLPVKSPPAATEPSR
jgi:hypothetical protein